MPYKVKFRDKNGNITSKEFMMLDAAERYYYEIQSKFEAIEMILTGPEGTIDHCYLIGSKLDPIWIGE